MTALSFLPDADVIAFRFGIPYHHPLGHRGAAHSLVFAAFLGLVAAALVRRHRFHHGLLVMAVVASHGILDAFTDGGLGIAFLWPFSSARFFAPVQPLPVAPIGLGMISGYGLRVLLTELAFFLPLLVYGLWPGRRGSKD